MEEKKEVVTHQENQEGKIPEGKVELTPKQEEELKTEGVETRED